MQSLNRFKAGGRSPVSLRPQALVRRGTLDGGGLPLLVEPAIADLDAAAWARANREEVERDLLEHGAVLFRGFGLDSAERFEEFARAVSPGLLDYGERSSPRSEISQGVYTSTDYPAGEAIHFHNEQSYTRSWPTKLWFYCLEPATKGGATPIADGRKVLALLAPEISRRFREKRVTYVRNYGDGMGLSWQTAFQTTSRAEVEAYCRARGIESEWKEGDRLRTRQAFDTVVAHPSTGEALWFEHAVFFHVSSLRPSVRESLLAEFGEEDLPSNTYYGDGSPIEDEALDAVREAYARAAVSFPWRKGDVLLIDNMLVSHSREPFEGPRKVLVAMAQLHPATAA